MSVDRAALRAQAREVLANYRFSTPPRSWACYPAPTCLCRCRRERIATCCGSSARTPSPRPCMDSSCSQTSCGAAGCEC